MREGVAMTPPRAGGDTNANGDGKITREAVLTAALDIIDRDGVDGLSMRRLARALGRPIALSRPQLPGARSRPPPRGAVACHAAPGHAASAAPPWHPAPARRRPQAAHPGWLQRPRRIAHLPGLVRLPARPRTQRTPGTRGQPRRDR